jgi:hypothetical protein
MTGRHAWTMQMLDRDADTASIRFTNDEFVLVFGALVESTQALSAAEFQARVGRPEAAAEVLLWKIKAVLTG